MKPAWLDWPEIEQLVAALGAENIRFVGGAVRDAVLGRAAQDVDAATLLLPQDVTERLQKAGIKAIPTGLAHGTITALIGKKHFEITTLRRDVATDGRHAEVAFTDDWKADASRRDFTMNALYLSPAGELFDYFDGEADAKAGHVRFIGNANARIAEDYLRILRFFRFHAYYGKEEPDAEALAACAELASNIASLSGERVSYELLKLLAAPHYSKTLALMQEEHILPHVLGFDILDSGMFSRFEAIERFVALPPVIKLAGFFLKADGIQEEALETLAARLKLSGADHKALRSLLLHAGDIPARLSEAEQKRWIRKLGAERFQYAAAINWAQGNEIIVPHDPYVSMLSLAASWQPPEFPVSGDDLITLGIKPGKEMGALLHRLESEWEKSGYTLTKKELLTLAK